MKDIILASASPRRIEMFRNSGIDVKIMPADIDESLPKGIGAIDAVMFLALKKALYIEEKLLGEEKLSDEKKLFGEGGQGSLIIAADTVVFKDGILGKPAGANEAFEMLKSLRGTSHYVATGVAVLEAGGSYRKVFYDRTEVEFTDYSDDEIRAYIATGEPMDKAGAYAIQGGFGKYVKEYRGSYKNIVGFPWEKFEREISDCEAWNLKKGMKNV